MSPTRTARCASLAQELTLRMIAARRRREEFDDAGELPPDQRAAPAGRHGAAGLRLRQRPGLHGDRTPARRRPRLRDAAAARRVVVPADATHHNICTMAHLVPAGGAGPSVMDRLRPTDRSNMSGRTARNCVVPAGADGRFIRRPELDIDVDRRSTPRRCAVRWGRRSRNPNQTWTFVDDRLVEVTGPFVGTARVRVGPPRPPRRRSRTTADAP